MTATPARRARLVNGVAGVAAGIAGGAACAWIDTPLPWLIGSLIAVAAANLSGWRIHNLPRGRECGQVLIGTAIGLYLTPAVAAVIAIHLPTMLVTALLLTLMGAMGALILGRIARVDPVTAYFGSVPGGMAEMLVIGDRLGARPVEMTIAQVVRVTIVVITIPFALTWLGGTGVDPYTRPNIPLDWPKLALLLALTLGVAAALNRLRLTNAWALGSVAMAGALTAFEIHLSSMPTFLSNLAQVLIGVGIGQRFNREDFARSPLVIVGAAVSTVAMMALCLAIAVPLAAITGLAMPSMVAATAPGGLAEMSITAKVLGLGVPVVTAFHVARIFMIALTALPIYRGLQALQSRRTAAGE